MASIRYNLKIKRPSEETLEVDVIKKFDDYDIPASEILQGYYLIVMNALNENKKVFMIENKILKTEPVPEFELDIITREK